MRLSAVGIQPRASSFQHPASSIRYPVSVLPHPHSLLTLLASAGSSWRPWGNALAESRMKILALEFSSSERSVAIVQGRGPRPATESDSLSVHKVVSTPTGASKDTSWKVAEVVESGALGANAIGMIEAALCQAQVEREQIERLVVGLGPGSYNGIRLAIAVAQGWQLASGEEGIKLLGISSAECIAVQGQEEGLAGRVNVVIDAQRGEFY